MTAPPLGRLPGLPGSEYYPCPAKGSSPIRIASMQTAAHYLAQSGKEATPAMRLGSLTHAAVLEPTRFESDFVVATVQQCASTTKKGTQCTKSSVPGADTCGYLRHPWRAQNCRVVARGPRPRRRDRRRG